MKQNYSAFKKCLKQRPFPIGLRTHGQNPSKCVFKNKDILLNKVWNRLKFLELFTSALYAPPPPPLPTDNLVFCASVFFILSRGKIKLTFTCSLWIPLRISLLLLYPSFSFCPSTPVGFPWKTDVFQHVLDCSLHLRAHTQPLSFTHIHLFLCMCVRACVWEHRLMTDKGRLTLYWGKCTYQFAAFVEEGRDRKKERRPWRKTTQLGGGGV